MITKRAFNSYSYPNAAIFLRKWEGRAAFCLFFLMAMTSCSDEHLAKLIDGCWKGGYTMTFSDQTKSDVSLYRVFNYIPDSKTYGGDFSEALYESRSPIDLDGATIDFKNRVYIKGTWEIVNGDLYLTYQPSTLQVKVLPGEAKFQYTNLVDALDGISSDLETMSSTKDELLEAFQKKLYSDYFEEYRESADMDDGSTSCTGLSISDGVMRYLDNEGDSVIMTITDTTPEEIISGKGE